MKQNETIKKILDDFDYQQIVFDSEYSKYLQFCSNQELENILNKVKELIVINYKEKIYPNDLKSNLYNILSVYRDIFKSFSILDNVNELIGMLNVSDGTNAGNFLLGQFVSRYDNFYTLRSLHATDTENIFELKDYIYKSVNNDGSFFRSLLTDDLPDFINKNYSKYLPISNLCYLISIYPEVFSNSNILNKVESLLVTNIDSKLYPTDDDCMADYTFESINNLSLKDIKSLTR